MAGSTHGLIEGILSGQRRGVAAGALRAALRAAEPVYGAIVRTRNRLYDRKMLHIHRLPVPVVSVGNLTAGGTGKTPTVRWLAERLSAAGLKPAILLRGYKRAGNVSSDEETLLREYLADVDGSGVVVHADADRAAGGLRVLREHPKTDVIILDDGFQHRRLHRDFDLVLIDACRPFGFDHIHPRGLLREPIESLGRADAFIVTRSDQVPLRECTRIEQRLRSQNPIAPIYRARHELTGLRSASAPLSRPADLPLDSLSDKQFFAFAGIGSPRSLQSQLEQLPGRFCGHHWFADHQAYRPADLQKMRAQAAAAGADVMLVTEKDWTKLASLPGAMDSELPIWRLEMELRLDARGEAGLIALILARIEPKAQSE